MSLEIVRNQAHNIDAQKEVSRLVHRHFFPEITNIADTPSEFESSPYTSEQFLINPKGLLRGSDTYVSRGIDGIAGFAQLKYYDWDLIKPQLYFRPTYEISEPTIRSLQLFPLREMVEPRLKSIATPTTAVELSYYWVREDLRHKGLGGNLFKQSLDDFRTTKEKLGIEETTFYFTVAKGGSVKTDRGQVLFKFMLEREKAEHGIDQEGKIKVRGLEISWSEIANLGISQSDFDIRDESKPTSFLALKHGMTMYSFWRNLSPMFGIVK